MRARRGLSGGRFGTGLSSDLYPLTRWDAMVAKFCFVFGHRTLCDEIGSRVIASFPR